MSRSRSRSPARVRRSSAAADDDDVALVLADDDGGAAKRARDSPTAALLGAALRPRTFWLPATIVVASTALQVYWHVAQHGAFNYWQAGLALFLSVNLFVCLAELHLYRRAEYIAARYRLLRKQFGGGKGAEFGAVRQWFVQPLTLRSALSTAWADMWATYALFDDHYADAHSYPHFVDCGNGHFTLLPSLLLMCGMTNDLSAVGLTPRLLGLVSLLTFWTEFYGTVLYLWSFVHHKRYAQAGVRKTLLFVLPFNVPWLIAPAFGLFASWEMILNNSANRFH